MRVMVVVMVPSQHEDLTYATAATSSILKIRWPSSGFVMRVHSEGASGSHVYGGPIRRNGS